MRVWVDLTNSPHVLVMRPVIARLRAGGHVVAVTARDFSQTLELCDRLGIEHTPIGRHRGGRVALLLQNPGDYFLAERVSDELGERALAQAGLSGVAERAARLLGVPCSTMFDYEWATVQHNINCRLAQAVVVPEAIPPQRLSRYGADGKLGRYAGLKEEYYLADFEPDDRVLRELGLDASEPILVVRTPPDVSLYHRFENDLFADVLARVRGAQAVVLPRIARQRRELVAAGGFIVPEEAIDAQSLIAHADLVISAGGTMNREAVALGTPVWTTFEGRLGAVDAALIADGRLRRLERSDQLELRKRDSRAAGERVRRDIGILVGLLSAPADA